MDLQDSEYGLGQNPPYSLYQDENGKWGLVDGNGKRLRAIFDRLNEYDFSSSPWEIVSFDEQEGLQVVAWYDPHEVWFNFTFNNPAYPAEFAGYMWKRRDKTVEDFKEELYTLMPEEQHWLLDEIMRYKELDRMEDADFNLAIEAILSEHPELKDPSIVNPLLDPVMRNPEVSEDIKQALWHAKLNLDYSIRHYFKEDDEDF